MNKWKNKFQHAMAGRYGIDELNRILSILSILAFIASFFGGRIIFYPMALFLLILCYARTFSKNIQKRRAENQVYLNIRYKMHVWMDKIKRRFTTSKTHKIFCCPKCKQKIRVPKGKKKICITCPKCHEEFIKRT